MSKEFHIEMIDNIEDYTTAMQSVKDSKRYTTATGSQQRCIVRGMCDIVEKKLGVFSSPGSNLSDEAISEVFDDSYFGGDDGVSRDGCYE